MTNQPNDLPTELRFLDARGLRWLWRYLYKEVGNRIGAEDHVEPSRRRAWLAAHIHGRTDRERLIAAILAAHKNAVVPEEHLHWLEPGNQRLLIWMLHEVQWPRRLEIGRRMDSDYGRNAPPPPQPPPVLFLHPGIRVPLDVPSAERRDEIILALDTWQDSMDYKLNFIRYCQARWKQVHTPDRETKWLRRGLLAKGGLTREDARLEEIQIEWAWNYLKEHSGMASTPPVAPPPLGNPVGFRVALSISEPITHEDRRAAVLASLDRMPIVSPSDRTLFIDKMKKTWAQKKYRDSGKAKKPYYLRLTLPARKKLDWLAENFNMKDVEVLESLIKQKFEIEKAAAAADAADSATRKK